MAQPDTATANGTKPNAVAKALSIIETIQQARGSLSLKELAARLGMNKSTVHHLAATLTQRGFLSQESATRKYNIGLHLVEIGQAHLDQLDVRVTARPFMERLSRDVGEIVYLVVLDRCDIVCVDKIDGLCQSGALRCNFYIGMRTSPHSTAAGKVLLAFLPEEKADEIIARRGMPARTQFTITDPRHFKEHLVRVRKQGFAYGFQEHEMGLQCVAAPIFNQSGQCRAALGVSGPLTRVTRELMEGTLKPAVVTAARQVSQANPLPK